MTHQSTEEQSRRRFVAFTAETIRNASSTEYPGVYPGEDHAWSPKKFRDNFQVQFHETSAYDSSFSLIGINAAVANAFRRILIAEVPTIAIETVFFNDNTSVIQDEVFAQRLGLIPFQADVNGLEWMRWFKKPGKDGVGSDRTDYNTIVLKLEVECSWRLDGKERFKRGEREPTKLYENAHVYAKQIEWRPQGQQLQHFRGESGAFKPVNPDILLAKLRPGQVIDCDMFCHKGVGADHAKFSPVATASYRLMPSITIVRPILGADAKKFARCFPRGVISIVPVTVDQAKQKGSGYEDHEGELHAIVVDPMKDTVSRECLRHPEFKDKVKLGRIQDHFIFRVESTGQMESNHLFIEAVKVLKYKCERVKRKLAAM